MPQQTPSAQHAAPTAAVTVAGAAAKAADEETASPTTVSLMKRIMVTILPM